jgi:hypothetical protein
MTVKNMVPRCVSTCRDGSQCGRRVTDGSTPPVCHIHAKRSTSPLTQPVERTPLEIIQTLMSDRDPAIRLRAANTYLERLAQVCSQCATREAPRLYTGTAP